MSKLQQASLTAIKTDPALACLYDLSQCNLYVPMPTPLKYFPYFFVRTQLFLSFLNEKRN